MHPRDYDHPEAGEWVQPVVKGYRMACCDCGLVHRINFRVKRKRAQFQVFLDKKATKRMRKYDNISVKTK